MRLDIQYLRAVAVAAVVLYHLWPARITGGYVGVDIFFVISGFLITAHLLKEISSTKSLNFSRFYARRARRILPSALTVLVLITIGTIIWTPLSEWATSFRQLFASSLFFENWQLSADSVDYLTAESPPSPVQHYWSLSVEEQFYLFWPLLLWLVFIYAKRRNLSYSKLSSIFFVLAGISSLTFSIFLTFTDPIPAYYSTFTRIWEFICGGLIALLPQIATSKKILRASMSTIGWTAIAISIFFYTEATPFPGWAAILPVFGTALVIWANVQYKSPENMGSFLQKPVLMAAELSFAIYLFHWPLIIFWEQATGSALNWREKLLILFMTVFFAWLTTRFIEQPIRFGSFSKNLSNKFQLIISIMAIFALALSSITAGVVVDRLSNLIKETSTTAELPECFGALAVLNAEQCSKVTYESITPDPELAHLDKSEIATGSECAATQDQTEVISCVFGNPNSSFRVALIGDSHAMAIFPAIESLAIDMDWSLTTYVRSACPFLEDGYKGELTQKEQNCNEWNQNLAVELAKQKPYEIVFVTSNHRNNLWGSDEEAAISMSGAWEKVTSRGTKIIAIRDVPNMSGALECLQKNANTLPNCAVGKDIALGSDPITLAAENKENALLVDLSKYFCDPDLCNIVVGGVITHRDNHHVTNTFALTLKDPIREILIQKKLLPN